MKSNFSFEEQQFIKNNVSGKTVKELTKIFNNQFNTNVEENKIRNFKKKNKLKSGVSTKFVKHQSAHNYKPVGSEFITKDGYTMIKTVDPNTWELKHRYLYKKYKGKISKGYSVIFKDKNKTNFNLDNLILIEVKDKLTAKNQHLLYESAELTETGLLVAKLINETSKIKRSEDEKI